MMMGSYMRSEDFLQLLSQVVEERKDAPGKRPKYRVMVNGSATDELIWFKEIESLGAAIVTDALCWGSKALYKQIVEKEGSPMHRLSVEYLANLLCPRMGNQYPMRKEFLLNEVKRAKVDGVITLINKFCVLYGTDSVVLAKHLGESTGIPSLNLEKGYGAASDLGRIKTRIQAFLERIGGGAR
jgi:benzoyl-CoA reductase/2-hydroxyglutaryl-CoA dehydratase subunit BcrC/BadD/HgdB